MASLNKYDNASPMLSPTAGRQAAGATPMEKGKVEARVAIEMEERVAEKVVVKAGAVERARAREKADQRRNRM